MPKVDTVSATFTDREKDYDVWYTRRNKFEIKGLPEKFIQVMDGQFVTKDYESVEAAQEALDHAVPIYRKKIATEKKVILFRVSASEPMTRVPGDIVAGQRLYNERKKGISDRIHSFYEPSMGFSHGSVLGFHYMVAIETNDGTREYTVVQEPGLKQKQGRFAEYDVIDWTEDRQRFFQMIDEGMNTLMFKLSSFFAEDATELARRIDKAGSNLKLL